MRSRRPSHLIERLGDCLWRLTRRRRGGEPVTSHRVRWWCFEALLVDGWRLFCPKSQWGSERAKDALRSKWEPQDQKEDELSYPVATQRERCTETKRPKLLVSLLETFIRCFIVAHTGNAWEGSPVFADVLIVLNSWFWCSLRIANYCCFSSALLYGLLYKWIKSSEVWRGEETLPVQKTIARFRGLHLRVCHWQWR